jgi:hypothetical protein
MTAPTDGIRWFQKNFAKPLTSALAAGPYTIHLVTAIAMAETFDDVWNGMIGIYSAERVLSLCVGDTLDSPKRDPNAFPRSMDDLVAAPNGRKMFRIARIALEALAGHERGYATPADNFQKFCHGYGIFQYDIQHFKEDPDFFLDLKWYDFSECVTKLVSELDNARIGLYGENKALLTQKEMVFVAIAYNWGASRTKTDGDFKQGFESDGKYYGERINDYMTLSQAIPTA